MFARNDLVFVGGPVVHDYAAVNAPDTFAGIWIDHIAGGVLRVAFTADADRHAQALHELLGDDYPVATTTFPNSLAELVAVRRTIDFDIDLGGAILFGNGIRHPINRIHLDVQAADDEARRRLAEAYGGDRICVGATGGPALDDPPGGGVPGAIALPDTDVANCEEALLAEVTLRGDRDLDGGCVWVEGDDGTPLNIIWPPKYAVLFHDDGGFELLDHQGTTVAHDGDRLEMGGGWHDVTPERCAIAGADTGDGSFIAGSVTVAGS